MGDAVDLDFCQGLMANNIIKGVKGDPLLINAPGEFEISGIQIQGHTSLDANNQTNLFLVVKRKNKFKFVGY